MLNAPNSWKCVKCKNLKNKVLTCDDCMKNFCGDCPVETKCDECENNLIVLESVQQRLMNMKFICNYCEEEMDYELSQTHPKTKNEHTNKCKGKFFFNFFFFINFLIILLFIRFILF